jgi:hypothetical protein
MRTHTGNHNGGTVRIGPDDKLYVSVGDTGLGDESPNPGQAANPYAQDLNALEGKVLRLELDGSPAAGNPFIGQAGKRGEVWAYGFRNPWRFGFDPVTGLPWLGDVGQHTIEELTSWSPAEITPGHTAKGRCRRAAGRRTTSTRSSSIRMRGRSRSVKSSSAAFAPSGFGSLGGHYFFPDPSAGKIYRAAPNAAHDDLAGTPADFVTGIDGYPADIVFGPVGLYYVAFNAGEIRRVEPINPPRPKGASPLRVPLVHAYTSCLGPNRQHGPPLSFGSCHPPEPVSDQLTIGTADSNGQPAKSVGSVRFSVVVGNPSTQQSEADVRVAASMTDVRRGSNLADYTGEVQLNPSARITDRNNGPSGTEPATTEDMRFPITVPCVATSSSDIGGTCSLSSSFNAIVPGAVVEGKRAMWQPAEVSVYDGGADGQVATAGDNALFATQGIFVP